MDHFADNLGRLLGLHGLSAKEAAKMLSMSESAFSKWAMGTRSPSFSTALAVGEFFNVPADKLARAEFGELLEHELADKQRFEIVEQRIAKQRTGLRLYSRPVAPADVAELPRKTKTTKGRSDG